jgi:hypothetical protein
MTVGTKSVILGVHCILIHPFFVAWGWWKLYGFPWDPRPHSSAGTATGVN